MQLLQLYVAVVVGMKKRKKEGGAVFRGGGADAEADDSNIAAERYPTMHFSLSFSRSDRCRVDDDGYQVERTGTRDGGLVVVVVVVVVVGGWVVGDRRRRRV